MMYRAFRKTLVLSMTMTLTLGPSLAAMADGCGCGSGYSTPIYSTWSSDCCGCSPYYVETYHVESCDGGDDCESVSACDDQACGCGGSTSSCDSQPCDCGSSEVASEHDESCGCGDAETLSAHEHNHTEVAKPSVEMAPEAKESITPQPTLEPQEALSDPTPVTPEDTIAEPGPEEESVDNALLVPETTPAVDPSPLEPANSVSDPQPVESEDSGDDFGSIFDESEATPADDPEPIVEETAPAEEPEESMFDDMFDEPAETIETEAPVEPTEEPAEEEPVMEEPAESEDSDDDFDDLFGSDSIPAKLRLAGGLHSTQTRHWTDNTSRYHCQARLVSLATDAIVIEKTDGSMKRVPLRRLSESDAQFVQGQVLAQQEMLAKQGESKKLVSQFSK